MLSAIKAACPDRPGTFIYKEPLPTQVPAVRQSTTLEAASGTPQFLLLVTSSLPIEVRSKHTIQTSKFFTLTDLQIRITPFLAWNTNKTWNTKNLKYEKIGPTCGFRDISWKKPPPGQCNCNTTLTGWKVETWITSAWRERSFSLPVLQSESCSVWQGKMARHSYYHSLQ